MKKNLEKKRKCGHDELAHYPASEGWPCTRTFCFCKRLNPAPSQPSMKVSRCEAYGRHCGHDRIKAGDPPWGCSHPEKCHCRYSAPKKEKESTEVRDEKIARIVKEFREKFTYHPDGVWNPETARIELPEYIPLTIENVEAWLTQTLTTLLNEE